MFGVWTRKLFACVVIIVLVRFEVGPSSSLAEVIWTYQKPNSSGPPDAAIESKNSTGEQYFIEYSDYSEVSNFKRHEAGHIDDLDLPPGIHEKNDTNSKVVINKCCAQNYYFDVKNFVCARLKKNLTKPYLLLDKKTKEENELNYLFIESMPGCGSDFVMSVVVTSRVSVGLKGVTVEGEGIFSRYCIDGSPNHPLEAVVLTCREPTAFCKTRTCFRKCCPLGHSYGFSERRCNKSDEPFKPDFYNLSSLTRVDSAGHSQYGIYLGDACGAKGKYLLERDLGETSYLGVDGTLYAPSFEKKIFLQNEFCVEYVKTKNFSRVESFLCFSKTGTYFENSQLQFFLLSLGFIISCMFLLITFLVYLFSPKIQNLYGKTLMCYIACLFVAYLCLAIIELKSKELEKFICINLGYSLLFSFLAAFFWLNVMSFDIWKTFRLDRSVERSKSNGKKLHFVWYSVYAWGFPTVLTGICAYVNQTEGFPYDAIKPDIGEEHCWFSKKKKGIYVFFIAPISLVIAFNILFYVQTAWKIWKVKSDVKKIERQKSNKFTANKDQIQEAFLLGSLRIMSARVTGQLPAVTLFFFGLTAAGSVVPSGRFIINGKLFIVMGITWSLDIISYFAPHPIWYLTDAANALHGVFIFAVFILKKKVLHQMSQQVRAPLQRMRQLTSFNSEEYSTRKNVQDLNIEEKTHATGTSHAS